MRKRNSAQAGFAIFLRDLELAIRSGGGWFYALFFFAVFAALSAIAFGPELSSLRGAAPAVIWLAAAFALQFASAGSFEQDFQDGSLRVLAAEQNELMPYLGAKAGALFATSATPLILSAPLVLIMFGVPLGTAIGGAIHLFLGLPALMGVSLLTAALSTGLRAGGLLALVVAAPFAAPILVFGASSSKILFESGNVLPPEALILAALSLFMTAVTPGFTIAALKYSLE